MGALTVDLALQLAKVIAEIHLENIRSMPPEERAKYGRMVVEDMQAWRGVVEFFKGKSPTT